MKFTALEEYGLRCILHLARKDCEKPPPRADGRDGTSLTIGDIAEREGLTQQYAGKIFRILARAGLVESERGRNGGYRLSTPPDRITVLQVLSALGGKMFDRRVCGRYTGGRTECVHATDCAIRSLWSEIQGMVDRVLVKTSLADLVASESMLREQLKAHADGEHLQFLGLGLVSPAMTAVDITPAHKDA